MSNAPILMSKILKTFHRLKTNKTMQGLHVLRFGAVSEAEEFISSLYEEYWDGQLEKFVLPQDGATKAAQSLAVRGTTHIAFSVKRTDEKVFFATPQIGDFLTRKAIDSNLTAVNVSVPLLKRPAVLNKFHELKASATMQGPHVLVFTSLEEAEEFLSSLHSEYWDTELKKFVLPQDDASKRAQSRAVRGSTHIAYTVTRKDNSLYFAMPKIGDFLVRP